MLRKLLIVAAIAILVGALVVYLVARSILGSDNVRSTIEQQLAARLGQPVAIASASASVFPNVAVELHDVQIGRPAVVNVSRLSVATGLRGLFSKRIEDAELTVAGSRVVLPLPFDVLGSGSAAASASGEPGGFRIVSVRHASLRDIDVVFGSQALRISLDCSIDGDRVNVTHLTGGSNVTRLEATGALTSIAALEGTFDVKGNPLDVDEVLTIIAGLAKTGVSARQERAGSAEAVRMNVRVNMTAPAGQIAGYRFQDLSAAVDVASGRLSMSPLSFQVFGGGFRGRLDVNTASAAPELRLSGRMDGVDVAEFLKTTRSGGGISGRLGGTLALSARGTDTRALLDTARGSIDAVVTDGRMPGLDMVRTIVLAFGKPSGAPPPGSGSAFSKVSGAFNLANATLRSDNLAFESRDFDMQGHGQLAVATGALNVAANVALSTELTAQAGSDLRRYAQENGRVIVPATIGGTIANPKVSIDVAAAMSRALQNELQRRARSFLGGLFKKKGGS